MQTHYFVSKRIVSMAVQCDSTEGFKEIITSKMEFKLTIYFEVSRARLMLALILIGSHESEVSEI